MTYQEEDTLAELKGMLDDVRTQLMAYAIAVADGEEVLSHEAIETFAGRHEQIMFQINQLILE